MTGTGHRQRLVVMREGYVGLPLTMRAVEAGFDLRAVDPLVDRVHVPPEVELVECSEEVVAGADLVNVLTGHDTVPWHRFEQVAGRVLDTRNRVRAETVDRL